MTTATLEDQSQIETRIKDNGFAIIGDKSDVSKMNFAYTVGLADKSTSDLLMIGFEHDQMVDIISKVAENLGANRTIEGTQPVLMSGIIENGDVSLAPVPEGYAVKFAHVLAERARAKGGDLNLVQVYLPDENGLFPYDEGCLPENSFKQRWFRVMNDGSS